MNLVKGLLLLALAIGSIFSPFLAIISCVVVFLIILKHGDRVDMFDRH